MQEEVHNGQVHISDDVVTSIVGQVVLDTPGIFGMSGSSITKDSTKRPNSKNMRKGLSVKVTETAIAINLRVIVTYGCIIQEVCYSLQQNVRDAVEVMMGLSLAAVNVRVEKIAIP